jgi:hypothetical protein
LNKHGKNAGFQGQLLVLHVEAGLIAIGINKGQMGVKVIDLTNIHNCKWLTSPLDWLLQHK